MEGKGLHLGDVKVLNLGALPTMNVVHASFALWPIHEPFELLVPRVELDLVLVIVHLAAELGPRRVGRDVVHLQTVKGLDGGIEVNVLLAEFLWHVLHILHCLLVSQYLQVQIIVYLAPVVLRGRLGESEAAVSVGRRQVLLKNLL